jgi:hypothetical protein
MKHKTHDEVRIPSGQCPVCGYETDAATNPLEDSKRPVAGDISICMKCGEIQIFNEDLTKRESTISDMLDLGECEWKIARTIQNKIRQERPLG